MPLFFDGELDARQLRDVALHSTRCTACERELQELEHLQDLVVDHIRAGIDEVDLSRIWAGVAPRIAAVPVPWRSRIRARWEALELGSRWPVPALASLAAVAFLAVALWPGPPARENSVVETAPVAVDNSASLDVVESHVGSIALVSEPETHTMVLWINDEEHMGTAEISDLGELP